MKVAIVMQSSTEATVTRTPCWLARWILGRKESTVAVEYTRLFFGSRGGGRPLHGWVYADGREVEQEIAAALDKPPQKWLLKMRTIDARRGRAVRR